MSQNIPLAVILQMIGSFCFALAAHQQHRTIDTDLKGNPAKLRMRTSVLLRSIRRPRWILGLGLMGVSMVMQVAALFFAPVSVVQPVGLLAFPWSVVIQHRAARLRIPRQVGLWVLGTVAATVAFTALAAIFASGHAEVRPPRVLLGAAVVYAAAALFSRLGCRGFMNWRSLFWGSGGAMLYGLEAALVRALIEFARTSTWLTSPSFWGILLVLIVGSIVAGWMVQQGYATGHADTVVASMTITSPVVAVLYGVFVLGEGADLTGGVALAMSALGLVALVGVVAITRLRSAVPGHSTAA